MNSSSVEILPASAELRSVLVDLLGHDVQVKSGSNSALPPPKPFVLAAYKTADGRSCIACICDLAFAVYAGAALSLIPKRVAEESLRAGKLSDVLAENFHEILNVLTGTLNRSSGQRFLLEMVVLPPEAVPAPLAKQLASAVERTNVEFAIRNYGAGQMILLRMPSA